MSMLHWNKLVSQIHIIESRMPAKNTRTLASFKTLCFVFARELSMLKYIRQFCHWEWNNGQYDLIRCPLTANWGREDGQGNNSFSKKRCKDDQAGNNQYKESCPKKVDKF